MYWFRLQNVATYSSRAQPPSSWYSTHRIGGNVGLPPKVTLGSETLTSHTALALKTPTPKTAPQKNCGAGGQWARTIERRLVSS